MKKSVVRTWKNLNCPDVKLILLLFLRVFYLHRSTKEAKSKYNKNDYSSGFIPPASYKLLDQGFVAMNPPTVNPTYALLTVGLHW